MKDYRRGIAMFNKVWSNIANSEGEVFTQIRGKEFTYTIVGNFVVPSTTNRNIHRSQFEKALEDVPFENTKKIQHLQGPSYLYAILVDDRIRENY